MLSAKLMNSWQAKIVDSTKAKTLVSFIDQGVVSATNFFLGILIARLGGAEQYGLFNVCISFATTMILPQSSLIILPYAVYRNRISEEDRQIVIGESLKQFAFLLLLSLLVCFYYLILFISNSILQPQNIFIVCFSFYVIGSHFKEFCRGICIGDSQFFINLLIDMVASGTLFSIFLGIFLYDKVTVSASFVAIAVSSICGILVWFKIYWPQIDFRFGLSRTIVADNWRLGRWILASNTPLYINFYINLWVVAALLGPREAGIFAACNSLTMALNPAIMAGHNVILPHASEAAAKDRMPRLYRLITRTTGLIGLALGIFCLLIWIFGGWLLVKIYGSEFAGYGITVLLLAVAFLIRSMGMPVQVGLLALERAELNVSVNLLALLMNMTMNVMLIPMVGIVGSAMASVFSEVAANVARWLRFRRLVCPQRLARSEFNRRSSRC